MDDVSSLTSRPFRHAAAPAREADILATMVRLADTLVRDFDPIEMLRDLCDSCARILDADTAGVSLRDGDKLRFVVATSETMRLIELFQAERQEGPCVDAFRTGRSIRVHDTAEAAVRWPRWAARASELGFATANAFPMRLRGETIGALNVYARRPCVLSDADVLVGTALADIATIGLLHERVSTDLIAVRDQLQHALHSRVTIEQAKGIIASEQHLSMPEAFDRLRRHSRSNNRRVVDVARDIVEGGLDPCRL